MSALAEAVETATRVATTAPQSQGAIDTADMMIRLLNEILDRAAQLAPGQLATLDEGRLIEDLRDAARQVRTMYNMAVQIERLGGAVLWRQPLGAVLQRLERTLPVMGSPSEVTPATLVEQVRALLAGTAPERFTAATPQARLQAMALVANMLDQQHGFLSNFLQAHLTLVHGDEAWVRDLQALLVEIDARREELRSILDVALADAALAESDERIPLEQALQRLGL